MNEIFENEFNINDLNECETIEFKEKVCSGLFESLSAFANTNGGCILLGVKDDKTIKGYVGKQEDLINQIIDSLGIQPKVKTLHKDNKSILLIEVEKSNNLIAYKNIYYKN